jgi:hypothetical protein
VIVERFYDKRAWRAARPDRRQWVRTIVVETASLFARDLMVQEIGYAMLRSLDVTPVAADSLSSLLDDGPHQI